jgi:hypothetical protein
MKTELTQTLSGFVEDLINPQSSTAGNVRYVICVYVGVFLQSERWSWGYCSAVYLLVSHVTEVGGP